MIKAGIAASIFILSSFLIQIELVYLFPYTGLGRIITIPLAILLTVGIAAFYFFGVLTNKTLKSYPVLTAIPTFFLVCFINLQIYTQEYRPSVVSQIKNYIQVYFNYNEIVFEDIYIPRSNPDYQYQEGYLPRYVAALHKFQDQIPYDSTYSIYLEKDRNITYVSGYNPILTSKNEIKEKLKTGAERIFYELLENKF